MQAAIDGVKRCVQAPMNDAQEAAFGDLAYNIGVTAFCRSSIVRDFNHGDTISSCNRIRLYNRAAGKVLPGLVARRAAESELCLGVHD